MDMAHDNKAYDEISFTELVLHTLLDMFEFGVHSFKSVSGPYFWNSIGIDFEAPVPQEEVLAHAKSVRASKIYVAHTHPLSNDNSLIFLNAKTDPREKIAFGEMPLPLGNIPSSGDITFFSELKKAHLFAGIELLGVVFSASGVWEFNIPNASAFDSDRFEGTYDSLYPVGDSGDYMQEWSARSKFPSYFMELQKPKLHKGVYKPTITKSKTPPYTASAYDKRVSKAVKFFKDNGVTLNFHPYIEFGIQPLELMRSTFFRWSDVFAK
jgi:hypothetical protein